MSVVQVETFIAIADRTINSPVRGNFLITSEEKAAIKLFIALCTPFQVLKRILPLGGRREQPLEPLE